MFCNRSAETGRLEKTMGQFKPFIHLAEIDHIVKLAFSLIIFLNSQRHNAEDDFFKLHSCGLQACENTEIPTFDIKLTLKKWKRQRSKIQLRCHLSVPYTCLAAFKKVGVYRQFHFCPRIGFDHLLASQFQ